jgi:hypothetical protein
MILFLVVRIDLKTNFHFLRNWNKWKQWKEHRQIQQQRQTIIEADSDDEVGDVPDGQLCVICLMRRRRSVFIPCGHLVCCQGCAMSVESEVAPKCPVCRQEIRDSVRIFESWVDRGFSFDCSRKFGNLCLLMTSDALFYLYRYVILGKARFASSIHEFS